MDEKQKSILDEIRNDEELRKEVAYMLARDYSREYLDNVLVKANDLNKLAGDLISSDKEWQE